jgi:DNA repair exonuclease SbcCD ATPase subunit
MIESLEQENIKLNKELSEIKNKLEFTDKKLNESINDLNTYKDKSKSDIEEMENKYKKTIEEINNKNAEEAKSLKEKVEAYEKQIFDYAKERREKEIIIKSMESMRGENIKDVFAMKEKVRIAEETLNKNNEEMKVIKKQNQMMNDEIIKYNRDIEDLKLQIQQYKLIIEDLTPFSIDYVFKGKIINENNGINIKSSNNNLEVSFGKYQQSVYMKIDDQELILLGKEILDILGNKYIPGQVKFILKINDGKTNTEIIGQFTKKEGEYIRKFFSEFKSKSSSKDDELMNMSLNNYFY